MIWKISAKIQYRASLVFSHCGITDVLADVLHQKINSDSVTEMQAKIQRLGKICKNRQPGKTRVNIGGAFTRWRNLMECLGFNWDTEIEEFRLNR